MSSVAAPIRHAPIDLWRIAEAFLHTLYNLFGAPEDVARSHTLTGQMHALLGAWIAAGEALMRKLLVIEAAGLPSGPPASRLRSARKPRERKLVSFDADNPEDWRVSFRCFAQTDRRLPAGMLRQAQHGAENGVSLSLSKAGEAAPSCRLEAGGPQRFHSAWPLAERYECLIRVFNDPAPYARRLARRLHTEPARARDVLSYPAGAAALVGVIDFDNLSCAADQARSTTFPERRPCDTS